MPEHKTFTLREFIETTLERHADKLHTKTARDRATGEIMSEVLARVEITSRCVREEMR